LNGSREAQNESDRRQFGRLSGCTLEWLVLENHARIIQLSYYRLAEPTRGRPMSLTDETGRDTFAGPFFKNFFDMSPATVGPGQSGADLVFLEDQYVHRPILYECARF
jgi:hypothetical protein